MSLTARSAYWRLKLKALSLLAMGRRRAALDVYSAMLSGWPDDAYALSSRAHLYAEFGQREQAIGDARLLTQLHPQCSAQAWFNLAYLLDATGHHAEAEPAFRQAVLLDPRLDRAWYGLGLQLFRLRRFDEAIEALERNTELQPMSPYGWVQLARVYMEREETDKARRIIRHLKGFEPKFAAQLACETGLAT